MIKKFSEIKPYLRFVRYLKIDGNSNYSSVIPYDARLFYTLEGTGRIETCNTVYNIPPNSGIIINSGVEYRHLLPEESVLYIGVNFDYTFTKYYETTPIPPDAAKDFDKRRLIEHTTFNDTPFLNNVLYFNNLPSLKSPLIHMEKEYFRKMNMFELKLSALMTDILVECVRHGNLCASGNSDIEKVTAIINYIHDNYNCTLSNKSIAEHFHYHPVYISNIIKQHTGHPIHRYIKIIRTGRAADMLITTDKTIARICSECGFYDESHFVRCFKNHFSMTPAQYRTRFKDK